MCAKRELKCNSSKRMRIAYIEMLMTMKMLNSFTLTERQWELAQRTGSKSPMPVIVPMYLKSIRPTLINQPTCYFNYIHNIMALNIFH